MKCLVAKEGTVSRCANCPEILTPRYLEDSHQFKKRQYCSRECAGSAAKFRCLWRIGR